MEQSAVDFLLYYLPNSIRGQFKEQIAKAKEMEKEQIGYSEVEVIKAILLARKTELKTEGYDPRPFTGYKYLEEEIIKLLKSE